MRVSKYWFVPFAILAFFNACDCDDGNLFFECPATQACVSFADGGMEVVGEDYISRTKGECRLGHTECDENNQDICVGQIGPVDEICDGLDNDCDAVIDNGLFIDEDGDSFNDPESCLGPKTDCDDTNPAAHPGHEEICDGADNDCDGEVDEIGPFECWTGGEDTVFGGNSPCKAGIVTCERGAWTGCEGQVFPTPEQCDTVDNNCNGIVDDFSLGEGDACGPAESWGACYYGYNTCVSGEMLCIDAQYPQNEVCNSADDNCDGIVDEGLERLCETDCGFGVEFCSYGSWEGCTAATPGIEYCDGFDNDCDGEVDEGCPCIEGDAQSCVEDPMEDQYTGAMMSCGVGVQICDQFGMWGECFWFGTEEEVCNNWDDDCDGVIDMMESACGVQSSETLGVGECKAGVATCEEGEWGECVGEIGPTEEVCDELDNDCDGEIDEDLNIHEKVDMVFAIDISGSMCPYIHALAQGISAYVADFADTEHRFGLVVLPPSNHAPMGAYQPRYEVITIPPLVDVTSFLARLAILDCDGGGMEPSYDTLYDLVLPSDPAGIGWRNDAYPYIIMITDEAAQTWSNLGQSHISPYIIDCQIGSCVPGDKIEVFIISKTTYLWNWDSILYGELDRYYEIGPADGNRYTMMLQDIFANVCMPEGADGGTELSN